MIFLLEIDVGPGSAEPKSRPTTVVAIFVSDVNSVIVYKWLTGPIYKWLAFARPVAEPNIAGLVMSVADIEGPPDHPFTRLTQPPFKLVMSTGSLQPSLDNKLVDASLPSSSYKVW